MIRQDFSEAIARRRERLPGQWRSVGVPEALIDEAMAVLHPTGVPYLDLVLSNGMFAAGVSRKFCTEHLKILPSDRQVVSPLLDQGISVVQWLGIRRDESDARSDARLVTRSRGFPNADGSRPALVYYRPLIHWTLGDVLDMHAKHGLPMNPLYAQGFTRVGCFPCINESKASVALIARLWPDHIDRIRTWEDIVNRAQVARRKADFSGQPATFFPSGKVGETRAGGVRTGLPSPIDAVVDWSMTSRGGKQYDLLAGIPGSGEIACSDEGWCEK